MARRFHFSSSRSDMVLELTQNPRSFADVQAYLLDEHYTGQILVDFHDGRPKFVAFPSVERVPLTPVRSRPALTT